jgi:hypothetical protein
MRECDRREYGSRGGGDGIDMDEGRGERRAHYLEGRARGRGGQGEGRESVLRRRIDWRWPERERNR